jgi:uncharacterized protein
MQRELPESANFIRCAERDRSFEGDWPVARFERLIPVLNTDQGKVHAILKFGERSGIGYLKAELSTDLDMLCQRCAQPMIQHVEGSFLFGFIRKEGQMDSLPDDMEPLMVVDEEQSILELIEDELLLSLPQVNAHAEECSDYLRQQNERREADKMASSPFAVLKNLMSDKN